MIDKTNNGASFVGSAACISCHPGIGAEHALSGHAQTLQAITGVAPEYPDGAERAGVPDPPSGFTWADIAYVIDGYSKGAAFVDLAGFLLTTGVDGVPAAWALAFPPNGATPGFVDIESDAIEPPPFDFERFARLTTGAQRGGSQDNRPGIDGTWMEAGVGCEACHGPGSNHIPNPANRDLFVDPDGSQTCNACHAVPFGSAGDTIRAGGGYIEPYQQYNELQASGGHANLLCGYCHESHVSLSQDPAVAVRNECVVCHTTTNMALHAGLVYERGGYSERLACESCHMPYAGRRVSQAGESVVGPEGRMGDTRTHIFRISSEMADFTSMFTEDGSAVVTDEAGRAAVSVDFVCLRCHNGTGNAFEFGVNTAADIAVGMHREFDLFE